MVIVRFQDRVSQERALGFLIGRYPGHSWESGEVAILEEALAYFMELKRRLKADFQQLDIWLTVHPIELL